MTETEAFDRLREWASQNEMNVDSVGGAGWRATTVRGMWVLTPPGRGNTLYVVAPDVVRPVHPSREKLGDVLESLTSQG